MPAPGMPRLANAIVALLDPSTSERVVNVWKGLEHRLGLRGIFVMPYPHFTFQVAAEYDRPAVEAALERLSRLTAPFVVQTEGIAMFGEPWPVVYIAVAADPSLRLLHETIWALCAPSGRGLPELYDSAHWIPHISLAYGDDRKGAPLTKEEVRGALNLLARGGYQWKLTINDLALVIDDGSVQKPVRTFALRG